MDISDFESGLTRYIETLSGKLRIEPEVVLQNIIVYHMASKQAQLDLFDNAEYPEFEKVKGTVLTGKKLFYSLLSYFKYPEWLEKMRTYIEKPGEMDLEYLRKKHPGETDEKIKKDQLSFHMNEYRHLYKDVEDEKLLEWIKEEYPYLFE